MCWTHSGDIIHVCCLSGTEKPVGLIWFLIKDWTMDNIKNCGSSINTQ
jgi:hypothetical protein